MRKFYFPCIKGARFDLNHRRFVNQTGKWQHLICDFHGAGSPNLLKFPGDDRQVELVRRDDVPSMRTIVVDGVEHWLGHVKDFTKNTNLAEFLPKDNRISMAWVRLEAGEELTPHVHPVPSMILIVEGSAGTTGDKHAVMNAGDALLVPQRRPHGFVGLEPNGFWGLSIQFDSRGLYEDIEDPWATFLADEKSAELAGSPIEQLFKKNEEYMERFDKHRLFVLARNGLLNNPQTRRRFLDCFQVWSNHFQKMVLNRVVTLQNPLLRRIGLAPFGGRAGAQSRPRQEPADLQTRLRSNSRSGLLLVPLEDRHAERPRESRSRPSRRRGICAVLLQTRAAGDGEQAARRTTSTATRPATRRMSRWATPSFDRSRLPIGRAFSTFSARDGRC